MKGVLLFFGVVILLSLYGCSLLEPVSVTKVDEVKLEQMSSKKIILSMNIHINNPNFLKIKVIGNEMDVTINGVDIGNASIKEIIEIPGKSEDFYSVMVEGQLSKLSLFALPGLINAINTKSIDLRLKGFVKATVLGMPKVFPLEVSQKVQL